MRFPTVIPDFSGKYIEPFLGSGSVFFHVQRRNVRPCPAILGDINLQLIDTYLQVRDNPEQIHERLVALEAGYLASSDRARYYYDVRDAYNRKLPSVDAATFIFLNRTGWNGLYRVNRDGRYNVPHGQLKSVKGIIPSKEDLINVAAALFQCQLRAATWENVLAFGARGDFAFIDPPYYSDVKIDSTKYRSQQFTLKHHEKLAKFLSAQAKRGLDFVLTNSDEAEMVDLYSGYGFDVTKVLIPRFISSRIETRVPTGEIIVRPKGRAPLMLALSQDGSAGDNELPTNDGSVDDEGEVGTVPMEIEGMSQVKR